MSLPSEEQWRPVPDHEGYYEVSDHGRVRSLAWVTVDTLGRSRPFPAKMLRLVAETPDGRPVVNLRKDGRSKVHRIQVLVLSAFVGPRPAGLEACHNDGNPANNHISNLRWDTHAGNMQDVRRHGRNHFANKTHCPRKHELRIPNLVPSTAARGYRDCRACARARGDVRDARRRGRPLDFVAAADRQYTRIMAGG